MIRILILGEELGGEVAVGNGNIMGNKGRGSGVEGAGSLAEGGLIAGSEFVLLPWEDEGEVKSEEKWKKKVGNSHGRFDQALIIVD